VIRTRRGPRSSTRKWLPPQVLEVRNGSPCCGRVMKGDRLLKIGGQQPLDILDYFEASEGKRVSLRILRDREEVDLIVHKQAGAPLGLVFEEAVFDGVRTCRNHCRFCFVDQMPPGLRPSLYIKDDDYRLSFCYGNFITLNNLSKEDLGRIIRMRLSPLYVSLHTTDSSLRSYLMGGNAEKGLESLKLLLDEGLEIHLQVVVCPGINDGKALRRTFDDVLGNYPAATVGIVPLGLTGAASLKGDLHPHDRASSLEIISIVKEYQDRALQRRGERVFFAADEFFLEARVAFPVGEEYDGYPQLENGVGMARKFIDASLRDMAGVEMETIKGSAGSGNHPKRGVLTGIAGETVIRNIIENRDAISRVELAVIENKLFGESVTVTGLLCGGDIITGLRAGSICSRELLFPESMLREGHFIDDFTVEDVEEKTGYKLIPVEVDGASFIKALFKNTGGG
jgi:putative radical SAM enzyme (TIGR03279 family)